MIETPNWRVNPEPVLINCTNIQEFDNPHNEIIVQFETSKGHFTSFVQKIHVMEQAKKLHAFIIADVQDGFLIGLPAETLTSGPRLLVNNQEKDAVLTFKNWRAANGA
jgi:hypothetical protein